MTAHTDTTETARLRENVANLRQTLERCDDFIQWARCAGGSALGAQCDLMQDKIAEVMEGTKE
jgi:hypothetical protein